MFFRTHRQSTIVNTPVAAFVHQLSEEESRQLNIIDIEHIGAVVDIKSVKKEDTLMVEKLKAYRAELEAKKAELAAKPINVDAEVEAYRQRLIADVEARKAAELAKYESDINCVTNIIAREEELAAAVPTPATAPEDTVIE